MNDRMNVKCTVVNAMILTGCSGHSGGGITSDVESESLSRARSGLLDSELFERIKKLDISPDSRISGELTSVLTSNFRSSVRLRVYGRGRKRCSDSSRYQTRVRCLKGSIKKMDG
jgi:hypothetical protein